MIVSKLETIVMIKEDIDGDEVVATDSTDCLELFIGLASPLLSHVENDTNGLFSV
jgi:hypothetical protein